MLIVQDILVSNAVVEEHFLCNLSACKGACCWEGDYGAPLEEEEMKTLEAVYEQVAPLLSKESRQAIAEQGLYTYYKEAKEFGTPLHPDGACVYLIRNELGIAKCGFEQAYEQGLIEFQKPISCHLYPIRINSKPEVGFEALNYDQWDICSAACEAGKKAQLPLYKFVKAAIVRKYGQAFYDELDAVANYLKEQ